MIKSEIPRRLRAVVRARESSLIVLAAIIGAISGIVVVTMATGVDLLHTLFFGLTPGERLSELTLINPLRALLIPCIGGLFFGLTAEAIARRRSRREVDPIEANALHGGRMSLRGSLLVAAQTIWSSGVGASVGLEAGYTQLTSGVASRLGQAFRLRRSDLRILVGCGAAGAIAGAFGTPLAGAFYAFELIIGSYTILSLAPVGIAALLGYLVANSRLMPRLRAYLMGCKGRTWEPDDQQAGPRRYLFIGRSSMFGRTARLGSNKNRNGCHRMSYFPIHWTTAR